MAAPPVPSPPSSPIVKWLRGPLDDPWWSRGAFVVVLVASAVSVLWALDASGYGNEYYAAAAYSGSLDWKAWLFGSLDTASFISVDKPPLSLWVSGLSVRVFGLSPWSVLLPHAIAGVATVAIVHKTVRRWHGHASGLAAAAFLAVTPVFVVMARYNNPDAILNLLLVASLALAYSAAMKGSARLLAASGALVGLAFLTKTTQALLVIPAVAIVYMVAAPVSIGRRLLHGAGAAAAAVGAAGWWVALAVLSPAAPYFGQTNGGSFLEYVLGYNGLGRVTGEGVGTNDPFGGTGGWIRLFNVEVGGQVSWLIPLAFCGLAAGWWVSRRVDRTDPGRAGWLMWGTFFVVQFVAFSLMEGVFHPYYSLTLAPVVAVLAGAGLVSLWRLHRASPRYAWALPATVVLSALWAAVLLRRTPDFAPGLGVAVVVMGIAAALALMAARFSSSPESRTALTALLVAGAVLVAGPVSYSLASIGTDYSGGDPKAGPGEDGRPGAPLAAIEGDRPFAPSGYPIGIREAPGPGGPPQPGVGPVVGGDAPVGPSASPMAVVLSAESDLVEFLLGAEEGETWIVATVGSAPASSLILATGRPVMAMGGFSGGDPTPSREELIGYLSSGELRFVMMAPGNRNADRWNILVRDVCEPVDRETYGGLGSAVLYDCASARA